VKEDVHGGRVSKMVAHDREGPYEGPAVRVQLGRGHIDFSQECPLKTRERQTEFDPFEDGDI